MRFSEKNRRKAVTQSYGATAYTPCPPGRQRIGHSRAEPGGPCLSILHAERRGAAYDIYLQALPSPGSVASPLCGGANRIPRFLSKRRDDGTTVGAGSPLVPAGSGGANLTRFAASRNQP